MELLSEYCQRKNPSRGAKVGETCQTKWKCQDGGDGTCGVLGRCLEGSVHFLSSWNLGSKYCKCTRLAGNQGCGDESDDVPSVRGTRAGMSFNFDLEDDFSIEYDLGIMGGF